MAKKDTVDLSEDLKKSRESEDKLSAEDKNLEQENAKNMENAENSKETGENNNEECVVSKEEFDALNNKMQRLQADRKSVV